MKVATPHSLPEGENSSAGMIVSAAATKKACSVAVSVSSGSGSGAGDGAGVPCGLCASAGVRPVATAVPAPSRKLRRAIGILSSGARLSVMATSPCAPHRAEMRHRPREVDRRHATIGSGVWSKTNPNFARAGGGAGAIDGPHAAERSAAGGPREGPALHFALLDGRAQLQRYTPAIARNSSAFRLAPPTSAPSTSATCMSSLAFAGFTDPP